MRHAGPCGPRGQCWRKDCRDRFHGYLTIERLPTGRILAFCHRSAIPPGDLLGRVLA